MDKAEAKERIANFYNQRAQIFLDFEKEVGYNFWFLETFRLFFYLTGRASNSKNKSGAKLKPLVLLKTEMGILWNEIFRKRDSVAETLFFINRRMVNQPGDIPFELNMRKGVQVCLNRELSTARVDHIDLTRSTASSDGVFLSYLCSLSWVFDLFVYWNSMRRAIQRVDQSVTEKWEREIWGAVKKNGKRNFLICHVRYCAFNRFFARNNLRRIILTDENSPQQKVIQYAARRNKVTSFAVQHGNIAKYSPAYMFGEYEQKPILPHKTFLWGEDFRELLVQHGGYEDENLEVTGRIEVHCVPPSTGNEKTILFASQPIQDEALRQRYIRDVLQAFIHDEQGYKLVIRPHPMETDESTFHELAREIGLSNYQLDRETPLFKQMAECEGLIVAFSTVGSEFLQFNKPLIVLDYNKEDLMGWIGAGLGEQVLSGEQLMGVINSLNTLKNNENRTLQIERLFYLNDDKGLRRIYDSMGIEK